jgi:hypothetical protein
LQEDGEEVWSAYAGMGLLLLLLLLLGIKK